MNLWEAMETLLPHDDRLLSEFERRILMETIFIIALFVVAYLYASVGHGGASGYLALMAFYCVAPDVMKSSALILNLFVSFAAFYFFYKGGFLRWKLLLPFIITSVPLSFLGAGIKISAEIYKEILAVCLLLATVRMLIPQKKEDSPLAELNIPAALFSGGAIGLISGMIGIGGGIILSPLLLLTRWATIKESASVSSAFIFLNSAAGLFGLYRSSPIHMENHIFSWIVVAIAGGLLGSFMGSYKIPSKWLRYILCMVLMMASYKLIFH
jgi:uncharacterized membrane protein YfcA